MEHLKQFATIIGLDEETITNSQLQTLIPLLPLKIAVILMFLYAASEPKDQIQRMAQQHIDNHLLVKLLVLCFLTFYDEIYKLKGFTSST